MLCSTKTIRFFFLEYAFRSVSFQFFLIVFVDPFVCYAKLGTVTGTYNFVNVFLKLFLCFFLVSWSFSSKVFLNIWLSSSTQICRCWWSVFWLCSSLAPKNAQTGPSIPFPAEVLVLVSHLSMHSVKMCMTFWNSKEHAPG